MPAVNKNQLYEALLQALKHKEEQARTARPPASPPDLPWWRQAEFRGLPPSQAGQVRAYLHKYRCAICGAPPAAPDKKVFKSLITGEETWEWDWDLPQGNVRCEWCRRYVCGDHSLKFAENAYYEEYCCIPCAQALIKKYG